MKKNEMEVTHPGVTLQRQPWEKLRIYAAAVALSTQKDAGVEETTPTHKTTPNQETTPNKVGS